MSNSLRRVKNLFASLIFLIVSLSVVPLFAQQADYAAELARAIQLINQKNMRKPCRFLKSEFQRVKIARSVHFVYSCQPGNQTRLQFNPPKES